MTLQALVYDAYGTLYDVHSVLQRCEGFFPGRGGELSRLWRAKQLEYTWQRSLMQRYRAVLHGDARGARLRLRGAAASSSPPSAWRR